MYFNLDLSKLDTNPQTSEFLNNFTAHSFLPTITLSTRVTEHFKTLIDNIFVNTSKNCFKTAVIYNDIAAHFSVAMHSGMVLERKNVPNENTKRLFTPQ